MSLKLWGKLACLSVLGALLFCLPAYAADFNITTSPLPILLNVKPGQSVSTDIRVENSGSQPATLNVSLKKFKADGTTGKPLLLDQAPGDDYFSWVSFDKTSFTAEPGVWNQVRMTIATPPSAAFGYYYAVVFSGVSQNLKVNTPGNQVQGGTAVLVLVNVEASGEKKQLSLTSFSSDKKLYEYLPSTFEVTVRNAGNIHLVPAGDIYITRGGKTIATLDVNPGGGNILPDSQRTFSASWSDGFPVFQPKVVNGQLVSDKNSKPVQELHWDFSKADHLRFGHYTAHLLLTYDNGSRDVPLQGDVSFWVLPWKILPIIILIIILVLIGLYSSGRGVWRKIVKK